MRKNINSIIRVAAAVCLMVSLCAGAWARTPAEVMADMPAQNPADTAKFATEILEMGADGVSALCEKLADPAAGGDDTNARYLLNAVVRDITQGSTDRAERRMVVQVLCDALDHAKNDDVRAFLIRQLQLSGVWRSVDTIAKFLLNERLNDPAVSALVTIGSPNAIAALLAAFPKSSGVIQMAIAKGLGEVRCQKASELLIPLTTSKDTNTRRVAVAALANIGNKNASAAISAALAKAEGRYEQARFTSFQLLYAERMGVRKNGKEMGAAICRDMIANSKEESVRCAALDVLVKTLGEDAQADLLAAADDADGKVLAQILKLALTIPDSQAWIKKMDGASPAVRQGILGMLGALADKDSLKALAKALKSKEKSDCLAAAASLGQVDQQVAVEALLSAVDTDDADILAVVKTSLVRICDDAKALDAVVDALDDAPVAAQVMLLEVLTVRGSSAQLKAVVKQTKADSADVREAAFAALRGVSTPKNLPLLVELMLTAQSKGEVTAVQNTVVAISNDVEDASKRTDSILKVLKSKITPAQSAVLLQTLPRMGGEAALDAVAAATADKNADIADAAVRALTKWPNDSATDALLKVSGSTKEVTHQVLAVRALVKMTLGSSVSDGEKAIRLGKALAAAKRPEEKKQVIAALGSVKNIETLKALNVSLYVKELAADAATAVVRAVTPDAKGKGALKGPFVVTSLKKAAQAGNDDTRGKAEAYLKALGVDLTEEEPGFVSMFNGKDLTGWTGNVKGHIAKDGKMIFDPKLGGGNLYTEKEYGDFIMRFEFMLTPGANNGLGIRSTQGKDAAYNGMELQILDNEAPQYAKLQEYQYHGSVYGVIPAKRFITEKPSGQKISVLKPTGEWNVQEVIAQGNRITVRLNGTTITDGDIKAASTPETLDHKNHPGLLNPKGYITFCSHGSYLEFRNLRIKDLSDAKAAAPAPKAPKGFTTLFNGKDLTNWKGLAKSKFQNPVVRQAATDEENAKEQIAADELMRKHWRVVDGTLIFDGKGFSLVTEKKYTNFEMLVDWKIEPFGDSGLYLRGTPQVQIWDPNQWKIGSGGLYNNQKNPSRPTAIADHPIGEWNNFRIKMVGDKVTVLLNDVLVVDKVVQENYWDRKSPIFPTEQIELQCHGNPIYFKNISIRELD